jgi:hypothetical protein
MHAALTGMLLGACHCIANAAELSKACQDMLCIQCAIYTGGDRKKQ